MSNLAQIFPEGFNALAIVEQSEPTGNLVCFNLAPADAVPAEVPAVYATAPDFDEIDARLAANIEGHLREWFPDKKIKKSGEWYLVGTHGSLKVHANDGHWKSHESEDKGPGLLSLYAWTSGKPIKQAARDFADADLPPITRKAEPLLPNHPKGEPSQVYYYRDANGRLKGAVLRFDEGDSKTFRQAALVDGAWQWSAMTAPRPLYGVENLRLHPQGQVIITEGEKAADALRAALPDALVITWPGGSSAVDQADWKPLEGRAVTIWPDNDDPGAKAAEKIREHLPQASILDVSALGPKQDAADVVDVWEPEQLREFIGAVQAKSIFADIAGALSGNLDAIKPDLCRLPDDSFALYSEKINELHGEPSAGKTNIALAMAAGLLNEGKRVLMLDPEDNVQTALRRLLAFGATAESILNGFTYSNIIEAVNWPEFHKVDSDMVFIDGIAEALAVEGLNEDVAGDFLKWINGRVRPFARKGSAVLLADHVTKSKEGRGAWSRGTGAKLGAYDGVSYEVEVGEPYSPDSAGYVRLKIAKDRNGGRGKKGEEVAQLHFTPGQPATFRTKAEIFEAADLEKRQRIIDAIREIEAEDEMPTKAKVIKTAGMNAAKVGEILNELHREKFIHMDEGGQGKATTVSMVL